MIQFVVLLLITVILDVVYMVFSLLFIREPKVEQMLKFITVILIPIGGVIFFALSDLVYLFYFKNHKGVLSVKDLSFRKYKTKNINTVNMQEELDKVPIKEALIVSNNKSRRSALLSMLKAGEEDLSLSILSETLENEDGEVSHYAATALNQIISRFKENEALLKYKIDKSEPEDKEEALNEYIEHSRYFLKENVLSGPEQIQYEDRFAAVLEEFTTVNKSAITGEQFAAVINIYIQREDDRMAQKWTLSALEMEDDLEVFRFALRYYHRKNDKERFFNLLERVKSSSLTLDSYMLDIVRFYSTVQQTTPTPSTEITEKEEVLVA